MERILLTNFHSLQNAGDAALLRVSLERLRGRFPAAQFSVVAGHPQEAGLAGLGAQIIPRTDGRAVLRAVQAASRVISLPGNPFFSIGRVGLPLLRSLFPLWWAARLGKPLIILPQTVGPLTRGWDAALVRWIFRRAQQIYVRDCVSLRLLQSWGLNPILAADPSFLLPAAPAATARNLLEQQGVRMDRPRLGISVIPWMTGALDRAQLEECYISLAAALAKFGPRHNLQLCFFAQSSGPSAREDDREAAKKVLFQLPDNSACRIIDIPPRPEVLKACYGQMDAVFTMRLHAGIFALDAETPARWIGYLTKTGGVLEALGRPEWGIDLRQASPEVLAAQLEALFEQRGNDRAWLKERVPILRSSAERIFAEIT